MHNDRKPRPRRRRPRPITRGPARRSVTIDYKQPENLKQFLTKFGQIRPARQTRLSPADQRKLAREVKRARHLALLPYVTE